MRKLVLQIQTSIDGFIAGPNGEMDWLVWNWDQGLKDYVTELNGNKDCIVLGRKLAESFIPHWANAPELEGAAFINSTHKVVFTKTLNESQWENTFLAKNGIREEIKKLKNAPGADIISYGGGEFVSSLINHDLIDEYHLFINPVAIGIGMPIFSRLENKMNFNLIKTIAFECGIVVLHYEK